MRIQNSIYPYPVLSVEDEDYTSDSYFNVEYTMTKATPFKNAKVHCVFKLKDAQLETLLAEGVLGLYMHVECSRTYFRKLIPVDPVTKMVDVEIDQTLMRQKVELTGFLLANEDIDDLKIRNVNPALYGSDYVFPDLEKGDPLAVSFTVDITLSEVESFKKLSSIIKVAKSKDSKQLELNMDSHVVYVYLPEKQYKAYVQSTNYPEIALSMVIFPAVIELLNRVASSGLAELEDYKWYQVLDRKIELLGHSIDELKDQRISAIVLAQLILDDPLERSFEEVGELFKNED